MGDPEELRLPYRVVLTTEEERSYLNTPNRDKLFPRWFERMQHCLFSLSVVFSNKYVT